MAASAALLFILLASQFVFYPGVQNDEILFAPQLYVPGYVSWHIANYEIPYMEMSYVGSLKTWLYAPIFAIWSPSAASLRIPVIVIGAVTLILFYRFLVAIHGHRAAAVGVFLLATEPVFVLTECFDWGPAAIAHLILLASLLAAVNYHKTRRPRSLFCLFFLLGLGLWEKAVFMWILSGISVAALVLFHREIRQAASLKTVASAALAFTLGSFPLIYFNIDHPLETFRSNAALDTMHLPQKAAVLASTADGFALFNYLVREEESEYRRAPESLTERASLWIRQHLGQHRRSLTKYAIGFSLLCLPFLWRSKVRTPCLFVVIAMAIAWVHMALTKNAGGSVQHTILLWPLPLAILSIIAAEVLPTRLLVALSLVLVGSNLLVQNQYFSQFVTVGNSGVWSDAMYTLSSRIPSYAAPRIYVMDWGISEPLVVLHQGELPLVGLGEELRPGGSISKETLQLFDDNAAIWIAHASGEEAFTGINDRVFRVALAHGYSFVLVDTIKDRAARPIFAIYRVHPNPAP
jgi:4-amino-4-deoxy-L-arabinose transferase-like glycosyltransferase